MPKSGSSWIYVFTMSSVIVVIVFVGFCFGNPGGSFTALTSSLTSSWSGPLQ